MDKPLSVNLVLDGATTKAVLSGEITEDSDFSKLSSTKAQRVILDLGEIRRINSSGVREWIKFVGALTGSGKQLELERCSVAIVQQLNMISNFRGGGRVRSVLAPYHCEDCDADHLQLIELASSKPAALAQSIACPKCGGTMEFDEIPDSYLAFREL